MSDRNYAVSGNFHENHKADIEKANRMVLLYFNGILFLRQHGYNARVQLEQS